MDTVPFFEVLAFTNRPFTGNPAGVCLLENDWWPDDLMQRIAAENNLAETAFVLPRGDHFDLRWMTPTVEVDLCGHATLASAHVLFRHRSFADSTIVFSSKSGELRVTREGKRLVLDFPSRPPEELEESPKGLSDALGAQPECVLDGRDYLAVFQNAAAVADLRPDFAAVANLDRQGLIATAPGDDCDFVSRYFAPAAGIPEDPVTGSTHCTLIPYWSRRLNQRTLRARQISPRGGELFCEACGDRVRIGGEAITYVSGEIYPGPGV
ncbi:MAG: PhzF family phenazine biosynthesis protein [Verrucomicrobiota bacterium]